MVRRSNFYYKKKGRQVVNPNKIPAVTPPIRSESRPSTLKNYATSKEIKENVKNW